MELSGLPVEILEEIILKLDPTDAARLSECCNLLHQLVYNSKDQALWRGLYLQQPLDDPRECVSMNGIPRADVDWKGLLQRFIRLRGVIHDPSCCRPGERLRILESLLEVIANVRPRPTMSSFESTSRSLVWVAVILSRGSFLDDTQSCTSEEEVQLLARLHTYYGITNEDRRPSARVRSRAFIYDMRNYRPENQYGPLDAQGRVDWVHIQAIQHIFSMYLVDLYEDQDSKHTIYPMSIPFTQIVIPPGVDLDQENDWAGVEGWWRLSFCFCDHRELISYNQSETDDHGRLDISFFEQPDSNEAFRFMVITLKVLKTTPDEYHPTRPIIHFSGEMVNTASKLKGTVRMTPDNQVQWQFTSGPFGTPVFSSVGIHIGGIRASFGVLGSWTMETHDAFSPVGPFWLSRQRLARRQSFSHAFTNEQLGSEHTAAQE